LINLEKPLFDFLGKISYGIYVYHPLIIFLVVKTASHLISNLNPTEGLIVLYTSIPALTILTAYISYELFEKQLLRLKTKYSSVHSSDTLTDDKTEIAGVIPIAVEGKNQ